MPRKPFTIDQEYELVDVKKLKEHPQNPRRGDEGAIDESMKHLGWYGAVTAQRSTGHVLVGNHRLRIAKRRGAKKIPVFWKDIDDETALKICLADNRTADLGGYDDTLLAEVLDGLESLDGTAWGRSVDQAIQDNEEVGEAAPPGPEDVPADVYEPSYGVIVVCEDEDHQRKVYEELATAGHQVRVVAV